MINNRRGFFSTVVGFALAPFVGKAAAVDLRHGAMFGRAVGIAPAVRVLGVGKVALSDLVSENNTLPYFQSVESMFSKPDRVFDNIQEALAYADAHEQDSPDFNYGDCF